MSSASTLIVDRGDLPSLAACSTQSRPELLVLWHLAEPDAAATRRRAAVRRHAAAWSIERIIVTDAPDLGVPGMSPPPELFQAAVLLQALTVARQVGCDRVVWPVVTGQDRGAIDEIVARAEAVAGLVNGSRDAAPTIELPLAELSDQQVVELACEAPEGGLWPCNEGGEAPCRRCDGCRRWMAAYHVAGRVWPWKPAAAQAA